MRESDLLLLNVTIYCYNLAPLAHLLLRIDVMNFLFRLIVLQTICLAMKQITILFRTMAQKRASRSEFIAIIRFINFIFRGLFFDREQDLRCLLEVARIEIFRISNRVDLGIHRIESSKMLKIESRIESNQQ